MGACGAWLFGRGERPDRVRWQRTAPEPWLP